MLKGFLLQLLNSGVFSRRRAQFKKLPPWSGHSSVNAATQSGSSWRINLKLKLSLQSQWEREVSDVASFFGGKERVWPAEMGKLYFGDELSYFRPTFGQGQTDERELEINKLFEMSRPGKYLVFATLKTMTSQIGELVAEPIEIEILDP